jgi:hypothetical protein
MKYAPHNWCLLKITTKTETFYKVFGVWKGGYLDGDSWRLNSGIVRYSEPEGDNGLLIEFHGSSGSVYECIKANEGIFGVYPKSVLNQLLGKSQIELISFEDFKQEFKT